MEKKQYNTQVRITDFNINWQKIKSACMTTISKKTGDKEPSTEWKRKLLLCEHSPIRRGIISWKWEEIPYAISTHFVRHHEGCEKWIGTSREDRTGTNREERSQMDYVPMEMEANIQSLINISRKRLCMCADPTTRKYWEKVVEAIEEYDKDIAWAMVPEGIYRGGCPEGFSDCTLCNKIINTMPVEDRLDPAKRCSAYEEYRKSLVLKKK